jgi:hypothetical protein
MPNLAAAIALFKDIAAGGGPPQKVRSVSDLLDMADLNYRVLWAVRDARAGAKPEPAGVMGSIVSARHRALSWVLKPGSEWDTADISR